MNWKMARNHQRSAEGSTLAWLHLEQNNREIINSIQNNLLNKFYDLQFDIWFTLLAT